MPLSKSQIEKIKILLRSKIETKLKKYGRESTSMPFLARLVQDSEKIAAYSFIHSIATTLGMSIYEGVSVIIASDTCDECYRNYGVGGVLSKPQKSVTTGVAKRRILTVAKSFFEEMHAPSIDRCTESHCVSSS